MSIRQDIITAARGGIPERIPWTISKDLLPSGQDERELRSAGLATISSIPSTSAEIFKWGPNVEVAEREIIKDGQMLHHIAYRTPLGELTELIQPVYGTGMAGRVQPWILEFMIKQSSDYKILEYMVNEQIFDSDFDGIRQVQEDLGNDGVVICKVAKTPFALLWMYYTGLERLIFDLEDNPGPVNRVMEAMINRDQKVWKIMAKSPAEILHCSDNISADLVSPKIFNNYFLPYYQALTKVINPADKPIAIHVDGLIRRLADSFKNIPEGMIIEAFTPPPTGNFSVSEARAVWGNRPLWLNFPSSVHLEPSEKVEAVTMEILHQAATGNGFLLGITENMPAKCWQQSLAAIGRVMNKYGAYPIQV
jgi:hypothetical protein